MDDLPEKLGGKAIEEIFKYLDSGLRDFAKAIGGEAVIQTGGMLGDQFKFWRLKNTLRLLDQTADILRKRGVDPTRVLPEHLVPLLESASLVEDKTLQETWAHLLANAAAPSKRIGLTASYIVTLQQLSSLEVDLLNTVYVFRRYEQSPGQEFVPAPPPVYSDEEHRRRVVWTHAKDQKYIDGIIDVLQRHAPTDDAFDAAVTNLVRLGVVVNPAVVRDIRVDDKTYPQLGLTGYGVHFMNACSD